MPIPDKPFYRIEYYLAKIAGQDVPLPNVQQARIEQYLAKIAGQDIPLPDEPQTRAEMYLANIAGQNVAIPITPLTRLEIYLAAWAGQDVTLPDFPQTRIEEYLNEIANGGSSAVTLTVTGVSPLALVNAIAHQIESLTQYGKCEQRNLPQGFTELDYIEGNGTSSYLDTGIVLSTIDLDIEFDFQFSTAPSGGSPSMVWGYMGTSGNLPRWGMGAYSGRWLGSVNQTAGTGAVDTDRHTAIFRTFMDGETASWLGTLDGEELYAAVPLPSLSTFTDNTLSVMLFARNNGNTAGNFAQAKIYRFRVKKAGAVVNDLIPCKRNADNAVGVYDGISGTFLSGTDISAGTAAVPTPSAPMDLWCNNGVLTKPHDTYTAVDGRGTYVSPGAANSRIYKAFNAGDGNYTISVPTAYDFIVQYKTPTDGSTPTDYGNIGTWVNGSTTVTLNKGADYGYGIALRDHNNQSGAIYPSDFSGTIVVVHDDEPVEAVGTPEVLTVHGINLFDDSNGTMSKWTQANGAEFNAPYGYISPKVKVKANKYTLYYYGTAPYSYSIIEYAADGSFIQRNHTSSMDSPYIVTLQENTAFVAVQAACNTSTNLTEEMLTSYKVMLVSGATAPTAYEPYVTPQTVTDIPMLLSVGDYKDEVEIISGLLTHKVGVKVFDGTEEWTEKDQYNRVSIVVADMPNPTSPRLMPAICTHYENLHNGGAVSTVTEGQFYTASPQRLYFHISEASTAGFTAFLAAQYAAGTPVIVVYPLAEETTEQTTAHDLSTYNGTTIVSWTAEVSGTTKTVEYAKGGDQPSNKVGTAKVGTAKAA